MNEEMTDPLVREISELRAAFADSEARRAELEAIIEKALARHDSGPTHEVLSSAPSVVLEDRDREVAARALEDAATAHFQQSIAFGYGDPTAVSDWLRERAAAIRKGDTR